MGASVPKNPPPPGDTTLFLCGSRPQHFVHWFPIVARGIALIKKRQPDFAADVLISPFLSPDVVNPLLAQHQDNTFCVRRDADTWTAIARAKLVVTIPGTNTAQAMYLRRPMIVFVPLNRPESILLDGLPGLIGKIPVLGHAFMHLAVAVLKRKIRFYSKPNRHLNRAVVPEIVGVITPASFAKSVLDLYNNPQALVDMQTELPKIPIPYDAAHRLWQDIQK